MTAISRRGESAGKLTVTGWSRKLCQPEMGLSQSFLTANTTAAV